jgi:hypothetical protein
VLYHHSTGFQRLLKAKKRLLCANMHRYICAFNGLTGM